MIIIDYELSASWNARAEQIDLASAGEIALRYSVLLGDIILVADSKDFSAKWGWIPIVDFAVSLRHIARDLAASEGAVATFDFTESDAWIRFRRDGSRVFITANYVACEACLPLEDLSFATDEFVSRVGRGVLRLYPSLREQSRHRALTIPLLTAK